jgi:hypothetical protein
MLNKREILHLSLALAILIAFLYIKTLEFSLFWTHPWIDLLLHFLGGLWLTITSLWLFFFSDLFKIKINKRNIFLIAFLSVLIIGLLWEVFEYITGLSLGEANFITDTISDIVMDFVGAFAAYKLFTYSFLKHEK